MNEQVSPVVENNNNQPLTPLVERLDPSIGELSTMMGAMMTELLRRTLRGSVRQIDEELQGEVAQKVDATIADRLPSIEQSAAAAADKTAREAATEVAVEEVHALEQRAKESERAIVARIDTSARAAEVQTAETARALKSKIELAEQKAELAITAKAHELTNHIEATAKTVTSLTEEKARELARHIEEAEHRANEAAQAEATRQVDDLLQRSKKTTAGLRERIQALEGGALDLTKSIAEQTATRQAEDQKLTEALEKAVRMVLDRMEKAEQARLAADERAAALTERVFELEKPRGLRALWQWLTGRLKAKTPG